MLNVSLRRLRSHWLRFFVATFGLRECKLHTLIHTFPFETKLQYLVLN